MGKANELYNRMATSNTITIVILIISIILGGVGVLGVTFVEQAAGTNAEVQAALEGVEMPTGSDMIMLAASIVILIIILIMAIQNRKRMKQQEKIILLPYILFVIYTIYNIISSVMVPEVSIPGILITAITAIPSLLIIHSDRELNQLEEIKVS